ncbi:MAG: hypothetical protein R3A44_26015 [Caldilineaceae bacterium]
MENLITSLETLNNPFMITNVEKRYEEAKQEHERLQGEIEEGISSEIKVAELLKLKGMYEQAINNWDNMKSDEKRGLVYVFVDRIIMTLLETNYMHLKIYWRDGSSDEVSVRPETKHGVKWTQEEIDRLVEIGSREKDPLTIASHFPDRNWRALRERYYKTTGKSLPYSYPNPLRHKESYNMYLEKIEATQQEEDDEDSDMHKFAYCQTITRRSTAEYRRGRWRYWN